MLSAKRMAVAAAEVKQRFAILKGDRLAIALVGDFSVLEQAACETGATNLNAALLEALEMDGQLDDAYELEEMEEEDTLRTRLEVAFNEFLDSEAIATPRLMLWGLETLMHFGVNLRRIRQYAVNDRPIGLLIPGTVREGEVRFYGKQPMDCDFDQIWEVTT